MVNINSIDRATTLNDVEIGVEYRKVLRTWHPRASPNEVHIERLCQRGIASQGPGIIGPGGGEQGIGLKGQHAPIGIGAGRVGLDVFGLKTRCRTKVNSETVIFGKGKSAHRKTVLPQAGGAIG